MSEFLKDLVEFIEDPAEYFSGARTKYKQGLSRLKLQEMWRTVTDSNPEAEGDVQIDSEDEPDNYEPCVPDIGFLAAPNRGLSARLKR